MISKTDVIIFVITLVLMLLDIASGVVAAFATSSWESSVMRKGLLHKCSLILCMALGLVLNYAQGYLELGTSIPIFETICAYVVLMESGSVIENVCKGNPDLMPDKIRSLFGLTDDTKKGE